MKEDLINKKKKKKHLTISKVIFYITFRLISRILSYQQRKRVIKELKKKCLLCILILQYRLYNTKTMKLEVHLTQITSRWDFLMKNKREAYFLKVVSPQNVIQIRSIKVYFLMQCFYVIAILSFRKMQISVIKGCEPSQKNNMLCSFQEY